jgi:hypothetical protein
MITFRLPFQAIKKRVKFPLAYFLSLENPHQYVTLQKYFSRPHR